MNLESLLAPLPGDQPSGVELRNDARFNSVERLLEPAARANRVKADGSVNESAPPVDWAEIASLGETLAADGRDLRLLVIMVRVLFATEGFEGLSQGLGMLSRNLDEYWDSIHPVLRARDDPKMATMPRANALRQLENDDNGLLGDLRFGVVFSPRGIGPVSYSDVASVLLSDFDVLNRAASGLSKAEQDDILARHGERARRAALACRVMAAEQAEDVAAMAAGIGAALSGLERLAASFGEKTGFGGDGGLALTGLTGLLTSCRKALEKALAEASSDAADPGAAEHAGSASDASAPADGAASVAKAQNGAINSRDDVESALDRIIAFYERSEPSSPIPHVARRLRRMVSMDFLQLMQEVAPSGLREFRDIAGINNKEN